MGGVAADSQVVTITCDESGYEGEKLFGAACDLFAHASVDFDDAAATALMGELRERIRSRAIEYKFNQLHRAKHRRVLEWALDPAGPIAGHGLVYVIDKAYFLLRTLTDRLLDDPEAADGPHRDGPRVYPQWPAFLAAANDLLRVKDVPESVDTFFRLVTSMSVGTNDLLARLASARPRAEALREHLRNDPADSLLDPLIPAIQAAVDHWGADGRPVAISHDRQMTLSRIRVDRLCAAHPRLTSITFAESSVDDRVQAADVLAGTVRKIAEAERHGRCDPALTTLIRPFVMSTSALI